MSNSEQAELALMRLLDACKAYKEALRAGDLVALMHCNDKVEDAWSALKALPMECEA